MLFHPIHQNKKRFFISILSNAIFFFQLLSCKLIQLLGAREFFVTGGVILHVLGVKVCMLSLKQYSLVLSNTSRIDQGKQRALPGAANQLLALAFAFFLALF